MLPSATRLVSRVPWFVDSSVAELAKPVLNNTNRFNNALKNPPPSDAPVALRQLHSQLCTSPHLDPDWCIVTDKVSQKPALPGPAIPFRGTRRRRGGSFFGEDTFEFSCSVWSWILLAQVKQGTENRGAIESVVRVVRKTLLEIQPPILLPANSRKKMQNGWALVDAGTFAVHVLSQDARLKYFGDHASSSLELEDTPNEDEATH